MEEKNLKDVTVLVVDDEIMLSDMIATQLKLKGFNVLLAEDTESALNVIKSNKVNVVLSDIKMPGENGITLLEKIRSHDSSIPIVMLMTGDTLFTEQECIGKGAQKVLYKPFSGDVLFKAIMDQLSMKESELSVE